MNTLSFFLYVAGLADNISVVAYIVGSIAALATTLFWAIKVCMKSELAHKDFPNDEYPLGRQGYRSFMAVTHVHKVFFMMCFMFVPVALLMPGKTTLYLIAASELGETVVVSDRAQRMLGKVELYINSIIDDHLGE